MPDSRGIEQYRQALRGSVRALWTGVVDDIQAWESFEAAIRRSFTFAWRRGLKSGGILPADTTSTERLALLDKIRIELGFVDGLIDAIEKNKQEEGKLGDLFKRVDRWLPRYQEVYTMGQMAGKTDPKFRWEYRPEAQHCGDCPRYHGQVRRRSVWIKNNIHPQSPRLECMRSAGGVTVCRCSFVRTDAPCTSGPLPRISV